MNHSASSSPSPAGKRSGPPAADPDGKSTDDAVDLAAESVAGEEDPGASLDESETQAPPRGDATSVESVSDRGGGSVESASSEERGSRPRRAEPV